MAAALKHLLRHVPLLMALLASMCVLASCDVHEFPDEPTPPEPVRIMKINLVFDREMPIHQEIEYTEEGKRTRSAMLMRRYIIRIFPISRGEVTRAPVNEWIFVRDAESHPDASFTIDFPEGEYNMLVWSDFVDVDAHTDKHYDTSDFEEIKLAHLDNYSGSDETREAYRGVVDIKADTSAITVDMERPMPRYVFITTDVDQFIKTEANSPGRRSSSSADAADAGVQLSDYRVRITYPRYMAYSFNMFNDRPADSRTGVYFDSEIKRVDDKTAEIGFDYVFLNHHDTSINVSVEVYDRATGVILARIKPTDVPLSRSKLTVVRGAFLTTKNVGGAGIDPDFDGEFNIEIK